MSKKSQKRARRRALLRQAIADGRRDYLMFQERRGRLLTTPEDLRRMAVQEPFYLGELGLRRPLFAVEPPYDPPPIIHTARR